MLCCGGIGLILRVGRKVAWFGTVCLCAKFQSSWKFPFCIFWWVVVVVVAVVILFVVVFVNFVALALLVVTDHILFTCGQ